MAFKFKQEVEPSSPSAGENTLFADIADGLIKSKDSGGDVKVLGNIDDHLTLSNIGSNTHVQIDSHIADNNKHREIDDAGTSTIDLLSASKILALVAAAGANRDTKDAVVTVADSDITLSGEQTINGVLTSSSRVGVIGQTNDKQNGIYITDAGAWTRTTDANEDSEVTNGLNFFVSNTNSTKNGNEYLLITPDPIILGTTGLAFIEIPRIELGTTSGTATEGNDPRVPTQDENNALVGTNGAPSTSNKYVTDSDPRLGSITTLSVADINDPSSELASEGGTTAISQLLVYEEGDPLSWEIYVFDSTVTVANNSPFIVSGSGGKWLLQIAKAYSRDNVSWKDKINTKNAAYSVKAKFSFFGTDNIPRVINRFITIIARVDNTSIGDVRIFDATNALTIAEKTGITVVVDTTFELTGISNLPSGPAIFEVQLRNDNGDNTEMFALAIESNRP